MSFVKCSICGNVFSRRAREIGSTCGVKGCTGTLMSFSLPAQLDLKCRHCGNVYSSAYRNENDVCGVAGCMGTLAKFRR